MNTSSPADTAADLKEKGSETLERLKEAAREKVVDPVLEAGRNLSGSARDAAAKVAGYSRRAVDSTDEWVGHHPYPTAGITFVAGLALGALLARQLRW
jgi:ElaB/YqjD/DUF883 family membrane-anchored ribosome-binding protein